MGNYSVYVHINRENGKRYYGRTGQDVKKRWQRGYGYEKTPDFFADIKRIGWDAFDHVIVARGLSREEADNLEEELIAAHDTMNPERGYNLRSGGRSNMPSETVCRNISRAKVGHEVSESTREKLRNKVPSRPVAQFTISGQLVAIHPSISSAARTVGGFKTNIWAACAGRKPTSMGYVWRYEDNAKRQEERDRVKHDAGGGHGKR